MSLMSALPTGFFSATRQVKYNGSQLEETPCPDRTDQLYSAATRRLARKGGARDVQATLDDGGVADRHRIHRDKNHPTFGFAAHTAAAVCLVHLRGCGEPAGW